MNYLMKTSQEDSMTLAVELENWHINYKSQKRLVNFEDRKACYVTDKYLKNITFVSFRQYFVLYIR